MNSLRHQVHNPGNTVTTTPPPCLANPLVMSWHLGETMCHCMHVAINRLLFCQVAVDVPEHPDIPEPPAGLINCRLPPCVGPGGETGPCFCSFGSWLSEGLWELDTMLHFGFLSRLTQPGFSLCLCTVHLDDNTEKAVFIVTSNHD